jgi:MFS family permease
VPHPPQPPAFGARFVTPLLLGAVIAPINTTMISVALVPISRSLSIDSATVLWLIVVLYLVAAIAQPVMGSLADRVEARRVGLWGLALVAVAGVLPVLWPSFVSALVARVLLGAGSAAAYPVALTLLRQRAEGRGVTTPPGLLAGVSLAGLTSAAIGPVLGGLLLTLFDWPAVFAVNTPLALIIMAMTLAWVSQDDATVVPRPAKGERLDLIGMGLFAIATGSLVSFLIELTAQQWWLLAIAAAATAALIARELRTRAPFIDVRLMVATPALTFSYARLMLTFLGPYVVVYAVSQWLQYRLGLSSSAAGLIQMPALVLAGAATLIVGRTRRTRGPLIVAASVAALGAVLLATTTAATPLWLVAVTVALFGIPQGLTAVSNQAVIYRSAPADRVGAAAGLSRTAQALTAVLASGVIGVVFGEEPNYTGLRVLGAIVGVAAVLALALTMHDRSQRRGR